MKMLALVLHIHPLHMYTVFIYPHPLHKTVRTCYYKHHPQIHTSYIFNTPTLIVLHTDVTCWAKLGTSLIKRNRDKTKYLISTFWSYHRTNFKAIRHLVPKIPPE